MRTQLHSSKWIASSSSPTSSVSFLSVGIEVRASKIAPQCSFTSSGSKKLILMLSRERDCARLQQKQATVPELQTRKLAVYVLTRLHLRQSNQADGTRYKMASASTVISDGPDPGCSFPTMSLTNLYPVLESTNLLVRFFASAGITLFAVSPTIRISSRQNWPQESADVEFVRANHPRFCEGGGF